MLALVIDRVRDQVAALRHVAGATDIAVAEDDMKRVPAAYVLPQRDRAGSNYLDNAVSQRVARVFGVLLAVKNLRDVRGEHAYADLEALRGQVRTALLNWQPDGEYEPCTFAAGRLLRLTNQVLWWQDDYETAHLWRAV